MVINNPPAGGGRQERKVARKGETVCAVDFGSREVRVLIAQKAADGSIQIRGHGTAPGRGCVAQGIIQDLNAARVVFKRALNAAEKEAGLRVMKCFCGVNGKNVETAIRTGNVKLEKQIVELSHLDEAMDVASRDVLAPGKRVISSITAQEWYVDDLRVTDPINIRGSVLKARIHFAQLPAVIEDNLMTCIESQNREVEDIVFLPLAGGLGCLTSEDIDLGVAVLDLGHTTTGLAIYRDRRIVATKSFEWGGFDITRDVAAGLQISFDEAAELVMLYGISDRLIRAETGAADGDEAEEKETQGGGSAHIKLKTAVRGAPSIVERSQLDMIVFERTCEIMTRVRQYLQGQGYTKHLIRGMVLTGGAARIKNQDALAEAMFQTPARIGAPEGIDLLPQPVNGPDYVPAIGVIRHGFEYRNAIRNGRIEVNRGTIGNMLHATGGFISKYFF
jgi:cell division protein FtsA